MIPMNTKWKKANSGSYHYEKDDCHSYEDDDIQQEIDYPEGPKDDEKSETYWVQRVHYPNCW